MNTLIVITGPTASGKTGLAVELARSLGCDIIGADSRQMYRDIPIVTAAPTPEELRGVTHHFVGNLSLTDYYSAARYEDDTLSMLPSLFESGGGVAVMCGGSMMYVDAVVKGIDTLPTISDEVRTRVLDLYSNQGLGTVMEQLRALDPEYAAIVDPANHRRVVHALEICLEAGCSYTSLRTGRIKTRPFNILKFAIDLPRTELFERINMRVERMAASGLVEEARRVYPLKGLNSLNTVGLKEMFAYFEGQFTLRQALDRMAKNTRVYAKKQLTWLKRDSDIITLTSDDPEPVLNALESLRRNQAHRHGK